MKKIVVFIMLVIFLKKHPAMFNFILQNVL